MKLSHIYNIYMKEIIHIHVIKKRKMHLIIIFILGLSIHTNLMKKEKLKRKTRFIIMKHLIKLLQIILIHMNTMRKVIISQKRVIIQVEH